MNVAGFQVNGGTAIINGTLNSADGYFYVGNGDANNGGDGPNSNANTMIIGNAAQVNITGNLGDAFVIGRDSDQGTVTQNGGALNFNPGNGSSLLVAAGPTTGTYNMNGGTLNVNGNLLGVGSYGGKGSFNQSAGLITAGGITVGMTGGNGILLQSGGTITTGNLDLQSGTVSVTSRPPSSPLPMVGTRGSRSATAPRARSTSQRPDHGPRLHHRHERWNRRLQSIGRHDQLQRLFLHGAGQQRNGHLQHDWRRFQRGRRLHPLRDIQPDLRRVSVGRRGQSQRQQCLRGPIDRRKRRLLDQRRNIEPNVGRRELQIGGANAGAAGEMDVSGSGSVSIAAGTMYVGNNSTPGVLTVSQSGSFSANNMQLGLNGGTGTIVVSGGQFTLGNGSYLAMGLGGGNATASVYMSQRDDLDFLSYTKIRRRPAVRFIKLAAR